MHGSNLAQRPCRHVSDEAVDCSVKRLGSGEPRRDEARHREVCRVGVAWGRHYRVGKDKASKIEGTSFDGCSIVSHRC